MHKRDNLARLIQSPFRIMVISIFLSVLFFLIISMIYSSGINLFGITVSIIIPAVASYPVSYILIRYHKKIEAQKNELERINEINNRLISIIAHDIRNPISGVYSILDLLKMDEISEEELTYYINDLSGSVDNLLSFLDEILQWSKAQIQNKENELELFYTQTVWSQTLTLYHHNITAKNIKLDVGNLEEPIYGDQGSYSFVVRNILHNAIKFTPQNGAVKINIEEKDGRTVTVIKDDGIGISKETLDKILNGQEWITTRGTDNEKGTGFGLKAAAKYVELQNGTLEIESVPGEGTKVIIDLPRKKI